MASGSVRTYDPHDVQIIIGGSPMSGFADGTFVEVAMDENRYEKTVGADGEVSRSKSNNRTGTITLTLQQTSPCNDIMSSYVEQDTAGNNGVFPVLIREIGSGDTVIFAQAAWVEQLPSVAYSKEVGDREWTIATAQLDISIGGNRPSGSAGE